MKLYHGSGYLHEELMPGFLRSGVLEQWDKTESNQYLYASTSKEVATDMGFASTIDKHYDLQRYRSDGRSLTVVLRDKTLPTMDDLAALPLFVYQISHSVKDGWVKNANTHNHLVNEYKTDQIVPAERVKVLAFSLSQWLKSKRVAIIRPKQMVAAMEDRKVFILPYKPSYLDW